MQIPSEQEGEESRDARNARYLRDAKLKASKDCYDHYCPPAYRETDWTHSGLQRCATQIKTIRSWSVGPKGILATGPTGSGKTRAMWSLLDRLLCIEGQDVKYYHAQDFFSRLNEEVNFGTDCAAGWIRAVAMHNVVFIDDFGQQAVLRNREEWALSWFFRFIDLRIEQKLPLLLTTNLDVTGMVELTSGNSSVRADPLVRRLLDLCEPVKF